MPSISLSAGDANDKLGMPSALIENEATGAELDVDTVQARMVHENAVVAVWPKASRTVMLKV